MSNDRRMLKAAVPKKEFKKIQASLTFMTLKVLGTTKHCKVSKIMHSL